MDNDTTYYLTNDTTYHEETQRMINALACARRIWDILVEFEARPIAIHGDVHDAVPITLQCVRIKGFKQWADEYGYAMDMIPWDDYFDWQATVTVDGLVDVMILMTEGERSENFDEEEENEPV